MTEKILKYITDYYKAHGYSPTYKQVGEELGVHEQTVKNYAKILKEQGKLMSPRNRLVIPVDNPVAK